jgi:hypothetical protein
VRCTRSLTRRLARRGGVAVLVASDPPRLLLPGGAETAEALDGAGRSGLGLLGWRRGRREERAAT